MQSGAGTLVSGRSHEARIGLVHGLAAYVAWGLIPIYFKQLTHVPSLQILCHRICWSVVVLAVLVLSGQRWAELRAVLGNWRTLLMLCLSTLLLATNWFVFILAVTRGYVLHASLGYFINPLLNVLLGMVFLRERLRIGQAVGLLLAAVGVAIFAYELGQLPWYALVLPISFGFYGLMRKTVAAGPLVGLAVETTLLLPLALGYIGWGLWHNPHPYSAGTWGILSLAGVITSVPLIWFASAARKLRLSTLGFLQYITPTGQFLLAVLAYHESFDRTRLVSFCFIWVALVVYSIDSLRGYRAATSLIDVEEP